MNSSKMDENSQKQMDEVRVRDEQAGINKRLDDIIKIIKREWFISHLLERVTSPH